MKLQLTDRIKQLQASAELLDDALEKVSRGDKKYFIILGSQLRALICTGSGRNFHPLLLELAQKMDYKIECYGPQNTNPDDPLFKGLVFRIGGRIIGFEPYSPVQRKYVLEDWLNANILVYEGEYYTPNEVLKTFGDKEASHYDPNSDKHLDKIKNILHHITNDKTINEVDRFLIQTSEFVVKAISNFISEYRSKN